MCTSVCGISSEVFFNLLKLHLHQETSISLNLYTTWVVFTATNRHFESLPVFCVHCVLCTSCCVEVTLTNTNINPGFVLYDQLNKVTSLSHQLQINKTQVAYHCCFYQSLQNTRHFQRTNLNTYLPKMLQSKKLTTKISSQTYFTMSQCLSAHKNKWVFFLILTTDFELRLDSGCVQELHVLNILTAVGKCSQKVTFSILTL